VSFAMDQTFLLVFAVWVLVLVLVLVVSDSLYL
jgi:hypothetical protein